MSTARVVAVVVAHDGMPGLEKCLSALLATRYIHFDVLVVDNASRDGGAAAARRAGVELLRSRRNLGFAGGVNSGIAHWEAERGGAEVYALVNQDCEVEPGWVGPFVAALLGDSRVAVVGGRLYDPGGVRLQHAGARIKANGLTEHIGRGEEGEDAHREVAFVDYVTGALFAFRRETWGRHGPFDERFFPAYFEEADFCLRCVSAGGRVLYVPESEAVHAEGSVMAVGSPAFLRAYHAARMRFASKHLLVRGRAWKALAAEARWLAGRRALRETWPALAAYRLVPGLLRERLFATGRAGT